MQARPAGHPTLLSQQLPQDKSAEVGGVEHSREGTHTGSLSASNEGLWDWALAHPSLSHGPCAADPVGALLETPSPGEALSLSSCEKGCQRLITDPPPLSLLQIWEPSSPGDGAPLPRDRSQDVGSPQVTPGAELLPPDVAPALPGAHPIPRRGSWGNAQPPPSRTQCAAGRHQLSGQEHTVETVSLPLTGTCG